MDNCILVAELCCNHQGNVNIAEKMIKSACVSGANVIKLQKWSAKDALTKEMYQSPHPFPQNSFGSNYGKHREYLELSNSEHFYLRDLCADIGIDYAISVFDVKSAKDVLKLTPKYIKVPSQRNLNREILEFLVENFEGQIHISSGMTTFDEIEDIIDYFVKKKRNKDITLYHCTSSYPCKFNDLNLLTITKFKEKYGDLVNQIGFSGHHNGIAMDVAAYTLGAQIIERHFTLDRTMKGTDHAASLEPQGLAKLSRDLKNTFLALNVKDNVILESENHARSYSKYLPPKKAH